MNVRGLDWPVPCIWLQGSSLFSLDCAIYRIFCEQVLTEVPFVCYRLYQNKTELHKRD